MQVTQSTAQQFKYRSNQAIRLAIATQSPVISAAGFGHCPFPPSTSKPGATERMKLGHQQIWSESVQVAPGKVVKLHRSHDTAIQHLAKHILAEPARQACLAAFPVLRDMAVMTDPVLAGRIKTQGATHSAFAELLSAYREIITCTIRDATQLCWKTRTPQGTDLFLGTSGFLVVIENNMVQTVFLPGLIADPLETHTVRNRSDRDQRAQDERVAKWSNDQRYFHATFRPALKRIRNFTISTDRVGEYALLQPFIPRNSELHFQNWIQLRKETGHIPL